MRELIVWFLNALSRINWLEVIGALAPVATAIIAFTALKDWKRQDKAKRHAEFLDSLIDAAHTFIVEIKRPIELLEQAKIGMISHTRPWHDGDEQEKAISGAITFIERRGEHDGKRLMDCLVAVQPSVIKLRSLVAKGQIFGFKNYATCQNAVILLTWHYNRIEAFTGVIGIPGWNWENPEVRQNLANVMKIDPNEIRKSLQDNNIALIEFARDSYNKIYC